jgi:hypothetical protein
MAPGGRVPVVALRHGGAMHLALGTEPRVGGGDVGTLGVTVIAVQGEQPRHGDVAVLHRARVPGKAPMVLEPGTQRIVREGGAILAEPTRGVAVEEPGALALQLPAR